MKFSGTGDAGHFDHLRLTGYMVIFVNHEKHLDNNLVVRLDLF